MVQIRAVFDGKLIAKNDRDIRTDNRVGILARPDMRVPRQHNAESCLAHLIPQH